MTIRLRAAAIVILIDTSVWIDLYRDRSGLAPRRLIEAVGSQDVVFAPFVITEVLQGARDEAEWAALSDQIALRPRLELSPTVWTDAARIFFDLQRRALTVRSTVDCLIAQTSIDHGCLLLHNDRDFERIATLRPLKHQRLILQGPS